MPAPTVTSQLRARGIDALKDRRFDAAADLLNRYLDAASNDAEAEMALAAARSGQGKHGAALVIFERQMEKNPNSPSLHFNRGATLERLGRKDDAVKAYKMVVRLSPNHVKALQRLRALGGIAPPLPARDSKPLMHELADDIPMVIPLDDDDDGAPASRVRKWDWWICGVLLIGLLTFVAALIGVAIYTMAPYHAAGYAAATVFCALMLVAGVQAIFRSGRGDKRYPLPLAIATTVLGVMGLFCVTAFMGIYIDKVDWQAAKRNREMQALIEELRNPKPRKLSPEELAKANEAAAKSRAGSDRVRHEARAKAMQGYLDDLKGPDPNKLLSAVMYFNSPPEEGDPKAEIATRLEGLIGQKDWTIRHWAALALGKWGSRESITKLKPLLSDRMPGVRTAAKQAIETLEQLP